MTSLSSRLPLRCWAEIDLAALERNLKSIRASLPAHMRYVAVVKADAYGHGLHHAAARLMHAGADLFAVANLSEAASIRELGSGWPILLLSPLLPEEDRYVVDLGLAATVSSIQEVRRLAEAARQAGRNVDIHLKVDTGTGRLGVWHPDTQSVYQAIVSEPAVRLAGIFTHFASSDDDPIFTAEQRRRFLAALDRCTGLDRHTLFIHADNSGGLESIETAGPFNAVRVGLLQFGVSPRPGSLLGSVRTEPVFSFRTRVGLVKRLPAGATVSYGRTHTLRRDSVLAVLCAGYADGLSRAASNRGQVLIQGRRCPILGRVTMDQTIVDVTDVPSVQAGDEAVLVGRQLGGEITLAEFSQGADTIPWEALTAITKRVPRLYRTPLGL
ncbi:MAG TPA: alanine racemase [Opitutaceae bacterium]|nr:alanine racemase [Opitutaceae bacterium]